MPSEKFVAGISRELETRIGSEQRAMLRSLYLGGGTPSHLGGDGVAVLLLQLRRFFDIDAAEVTIEANPEDVTESAVEQWMAAGVNRVSLGVQSLSDEALKWMHRVHDSVRAREALKMLTDSFEKVSADIIFALPEKVNRSVCEDVDEIIASGVGHVSIYGLTAEEHTPYQRWIDRGQSAQAPEEKYEQEYLLLDERLRRAGFAHYEVSSFAHAGQESRHNSAYWSGASYLGVGPAAHGFDGQSRRWNVAPYEEWLSLAELGRDPVADTEFLSEANRVAEQVYLGLRTANGLVLEHDEHEFVDRWIGAGWGKKEGSVLQLNALGWLRLDSIAAALTSSRSR